MRLFEQDYETMRNPHLQFAVQIRTKNGTSEPFVPLLCCLLLQHHQGLSCIKATILYNVDVPTAFHDLQIWRCQVLRKVRCGMCYHDSCICCKPFRYHTSIHLWTSDGTVYMPTAQHPACCATFACQLACPIKNLKGHRSSPWHAAGSS